MEGVKVDGVARGIRQSTGKPRRAGVLLAVRELTVVRDRLVSPSAWEVEVDDGTGARKRAGTWSVREEGATKLGETKEGSGSRAGKGKGRRRRGGTTLLLRCKMSSSSFNYRRPGPGLAAGVACPEMRGRVPSRYLLVERTGGGTVEEHGHRQHLVPNHPGPPFPRSTP
jgi:hypothetical protein